MSTDTKIRKRKSGDHVVPTAKKAKTAKSAEQPAPLKSALKKSKVETVVAQPKNKKTKIASKTPKELVDAAPEGSNDDDEEEGGAELTADRTAELLAGFSSSEDEEADDTDGIALSKLPAAPTPRKATTTTLDPDSTPGVVYISRIPHGFYEPQMRAYFTQFGTISNLRLARNHRTGKSQHHAFIEFASSGVADIVAKTMDKYLLFGHILQCRRVPAEQVKEGMWDKGKGKLRKGGRGKVRNRVEGARLRKGVGREEWGGRVGREEKRREEKMEQMREMGYEFEMPGLKGVGDVPVKEIDVEAGAAAKDEGVVKLLEGKKVEVTPGIEKQVVKVVKAAAGEPTVTEEKVVKRKNKVSGATTTTVKRKVKVTA